MPQYIAFLRALNVGGRIVKMEALRAHFVHLGFTNVRSFIASGNVIFDAPGKPAVLERKIEKHLAMALGYEVETFLRSLPELQAVDAEVERRFAGHLAKGANLYVGFLKKLPMPAGQQQVCALSNDIDVMSFGACELYWLCHQSMATTTVTGPRLAKALGGSMTARSITSLRKLIATFG